MRKFFEKRSKTFENIRKYSKNDVKRSKIFKNIQIFCKGVRKWCYLDVSGRQGVQL